ncbi:SGNH/GDSL hydrolase family protein [Nocardia sp. CDC159]|uniref:SGNH/GDSL hydrolase family protein n=1 Tax=Nocardia pulmonis TaxID=2951408 RepID=A0A9X2EDW4_9NOCA|nr:MULTISPECIES: SGNH/GDSL hydrolase family protein [Nocardia]MCM6778654.1 SGNH/GDSL hydrolase family protein [Nocardia pulmonis]MCM6791543.1 SGNH/GDSL hydrolase family protein [Nocardia sp. CDC159]
MSTSVLIERNDPYCLPTVDAAALLYDAPWQRFGVVGDSLSAGVGDPTPGYAEGGWADRVAEVLRLVNPKLVFLNTSERGATAGRTVRGQFERMDEFGPDLLHLPCGANDIVRREPDFGEIEQTMRAMYELAARTGARLTTFTLGRAYEVAAFADWRERVLAMNEITRRVAADYDAVVVDMWAHPVNERANLLSADRIHFSSSGQAVLAAEVVKRLAHLLADRKGDCG